MHNSVCVLRYFWVRDAGDSLVDMTARSPNVPIRQQRNEMEERERMIQWG